MKRLLFIVLLIFIECTNLFGQPSKTSLGNQLLYADSIKNSNDKKAIEIGKHILNESKKRNLDSLWIRGAIMLGHIYTENGSYQKADSILNQAIQLGDKKNLELMSIHASTFLAQFHAKTGSYNKSLSYFHKAQDVFLKYQDKKGLLRNSTGIGIAFMYLANYDTAASQFHYALKLAEEIQNTRAQGLINNNLGRLHKRKKEYTRAIYYLETSIELLEKSGKQNSVMRSKLLIAEIYLAQRKFKRALNLANESLKGSIQFSDHQNIVRAYTAIAQIHEAIDNKQKAIDYFIKAIDKGADADIKRNQVSAMIAYSNFLINQKEFERAQKIIEQAIEINTETNVPDNLILLYQILEQKYKLTGDIKFAYQIAKKRENLSDSLSKLEKFEMRERLEKEYKTQKFETELANSKIKNLQNKETITRLAVGTGFTVILIFVIYFVNRSKQRNIKLKYERNEAVLREKNLEIEKNKEIESAKAEIKGQEAERRRLAKELHDGLGGTLATIKLNLSLVESEFTGIEIGKEKTNTSLTPIISSMDEACQEVRTISHHLLPKVFENKSLSAAIEKYFNDISRGTNLDVSFEIYPENEIEAINSATKNDIYRIIQELTNNVLKHAEASSLDAQLIQHEDYLSLIVEDDGVGFPENTEPSGIGLQNINSRIVLLNGSLNIDSQPNRGTLIDIQIPNKQNTNGK